MNNIPPTTIVRNVPLHMTYQDERAMLNQTDPWVMREDSVIAQVNRKLIEMLRTNGFSIPEDIERLPYDMQTYEVNRIVQTQMPKSKKKYFLTLTSTHEDPSYLSATFLKVQSKYTVLDWCWELTKAGKPHIHALLDGTKYINKAHIQRWNRNDMVDLRRLKTKADDERVIKYINKPESKPDDEWYTKWNVPESQQ